MKRLTKTRTVRLLMSWTLAALTLFLSPAYAATVGLNFSDDWSDGGGAAVTEDAFGVPLANWYNLPRIFNSIAGGGVSSNTVVTLPEGASLQVEWSCVNTYSLVADPPTGPGEDQVIYGYLDDTGVGYRVRLSGFRSSMASYTITLIASTDAGEGFTDAQVAYGGDTNLLSYSGILSPSYASGAYSTSTTSSLISTLATNNNLVITGTPRDGLLRSTLAGILVSYTTGGNNPPIVETPPAAPIGPIYVGSPFSLSVLGSGSPTLAYQWRQGGTPIGSATGATYSKPTALLTDSGEYDVVILNAFGAVTSGVVNVTIEPVVTPQFTSSPTSRALYPGYTAVFSSTATGGQLIYQWKKGETVIPTATGSTLTLPSVTSSDQGTYTVTVSNSKGSVSASADLVVAAPTSPYATAVAATKPLVYFRLSADYMSVR